MGIAGVFLLLQGDPGSGYALADQLNGVLDIDVHTGDPVSLMYVGPQLPLINVPVAVVSVSVIGHNPQAAVCQDVLIHPIAQIAVDHDDFSPALAQGVGIVGPQIVEGRFHIVASGTQVALAGHLHSVRQERGLLYPGHGDLKGNEPGGKPKLRRLVPQVFRGAQLLRAAAGADIGGIRKDLHDLFRVHKETSICFFCFLMVALFSSFFKSEKSPPER